MAGTCGNRTHPAPKSATHGFEDRGTHQHPSAPEFHLIMMLLLSWVSGNRVIDMIEGWIIGM